MRGKKISLTRALLSFILSAIFYGFREKDVKPEPSIAIEEAVGYKFVNINEANVDLIKSGDWILFIVDFAHDIPFKRMKEAILVSNVAAIKINSFKSAKLSTIFSPKFLPEEYEIKDGEFKMGDIKRKVDKDNIDVLGAVDIFVMLWYLRLRDVVHSLVKNKFEHLISAIENLIILIPRMGAVMIVV